MSRHSGRGNQWADKSKKGTLNGQEKTNRETKRQRRKDWKPGPRGRKEGKEEGTKTKEPRRAGKTNTEEKVRKRTNRHLGGNRRENTRGEGRA